MYAFYAIAQARVQTGLLVMLMYGKVKFWLLRFTVLNQNCFLLLTTSSTSTGKNITNTFNFGFKFGITNTSQCVCCVVNTATIEGNNHISISSEAAQEMLHPTLHTLPLTKDKKYQIHTHATHTMHLERQYLHLHKSFLASGLPPTEVTSVLESTGGSYKLHTNAELHVYASTPLRPIVRTATTSACGRTATSKRTCNSALYSIAAGYDRVDGVQDLAYDCDAHHAGRARQPVRRSQEIALHFP